MTTKNKWHMSYDILRILAMLAVISIHISAFFITKYNPDTIKFITENIFNALSGFAVPVFLMISGALLLNEDKAFDDKKIHS